MQVPGYKDARNELRAKGIDEVLVYCVNDPAVMQAWAKDQKIAGSIVTFIADQQSKLTKALDMELNAPGPMRALGNPRCKCGTSAAAAPGRPLPRLRTVYR